MIPGLQLLPDSIDYCRRFEHDRLQSQSGRNRWSLPFRVAVVSSSVVLVGVVTGDGNLDRFLFRDGRFFFGPMGGGVRG